MTAHEQILSNIERVGQMASWSGWQIRFVQAGASLLGRDFPGLSDPNISDARLIELSDDLTKHVMELPPTAADPNALPLGTSAAPNAYLA